MAPKTLMGKRLKRDPRFGGLVSKQQVHKTELDVRISWDDDAVVETLVSLAEETLQDWNRFWKRAATFVVAELLEAGIVTADELGDRPVSKLMPFALEVADMGSGAFATLNVAVCEVDEIDEDEFRVDYTLTVEHDEESVDFHSY